MRNSSLWSDILDVGLGLALGAWIPIKILYFPEAQWADSALDVGCLALFTVHVAKNGWRARDFLSLAWALPLYTAANWMPFDLAFPCAWLLLAKYGFVLRILKIRTVLETFDNLHPVFYRLISICVVLPVMIHAVACVWIGLGSGTAGHDPDAVGEYMKSLYWTIGILTTAGGNISAKTMTQMMFSCLAEVLGVAFFGYVLSNVASLLGRLDAAREHHLSTLDQVESFIRYNDLPPAFRTKVRGYYRYLWERHRGFDDKSILDSFPRLLRAEATFLMNKDIVFKVPFLKDAPKDLIEDVVFALKPMIATPGEHLFYHGELGDTMYFIHHGEVDIFGPDDKRPLVTLRSGAFFGEMALLLDAPRNATATAKGYCDLFVLNKTAFEKVMRKHPAFRKHMEEVAHSRKAKKAS